MILVKDKKDCCGCNACGDICTHGAITFKIDKEGFWYPEVNKEQCVNCGLCEKVCPIIQNDKLKEDISQRSSPKVYGCFAKDIVVRFDSTSGGIMSMLANIFYKDGGYVSGAVYTDKFDVKNYISNNKKDLKRLRSSKYLQSNAEGLYKEIKQLLISGEKVMAVGSPCQMAALRLYLGKEYDNLLIVDFLCRATNSPKVFHKYLESLEMKFDGKIIAIKDKNKDHGWHSLARKVTFDNGKVYYGESHDDDYRRGYHLNVYERPSCYDCKFKGLPRLCSDITLGDFWGLNTIDPTMDKNLGTSLVLVNTNKGDAFMERIKSKIEWKEYSIEQAISGNKTAILGGNLKSPVNREVFFDKLEQSPFHEVAASLFPNENKKVKMNLKRKIYIYLMFLYKNRKDVGQLFRDIYWNLLNKQIESDILTGKVITVKSHCSIYLGKGAKIKLGGPLMIGGKRNPKSKAETRILLDPGAQWITKGAVNIQCNSDIQIFRDAQLLMGKVNINMGFQLVCAEKIEIGEDVRIGRDVWIRDNNGGHTLIIKGYKNSAPVIIENGVWITSNNSITKGVHIGEGAVVAANSVVSTNVASHTMVQGNPAKVVMDYIIFRP